MLQAGKELAHGLHTDLVAVFGVRHRFFYLIGIDAIW
jgi:hypothetical protein